MSVLQILLTMVVVFALSVGQVLFKLAATDMARPGALELQSLLNQKLVIALIVYGVATGLWLLVLRITPLRLAYPFVGLAFIIVPILSWYWLGEPLRPSTIVGACIIFVGICVSVGWN